MEGMARPTYLRRLTFREVNELIQKQITAWLDLRNNAAHGKYSEYTQEQVSLLLQGVMDFIIRI